MVEIITARVPSPSAAVRVVRENIDGIEGTEKVLSIQVGRVNEDGHTLRVEDTAPGASTRGDSLFDVEVTIHESALDSPFKFFRSGNKPRGPDFSLLRELSPELKDADEVYKEEFNMGEVEFSPLEMRTASIAGDMSYDGYSDREIVYGETLRKSEIADNRRRMVGGGVEDNRRSRYTDR